MFLCFLPFYYSSTAFAQWEQIYNSQNQNQQISSSADKLYICSTNKGLLISSDSGYTFNQSNNGLNTLYTKRLLIRDSLFILGTGQGIYKSIDYGSTWVPENNGMPFINNKIMDIIFKGDSILVATEQKGLYCSVDFCQSWFPINNGFAELYFRCLLYDGHRLFAGNCSGKGIYISDDNGLNWSQRNYGVPHDIFAPSDYVIITSFTMINQTIFASTYGGNLLKSDDNGESWIVLNNPNHYIWTVFHIGNTLYTGHSGAGPCKSEDAGESWSIIGDGMITTTDKEVYSFCTLGLYIYATGGVGTSGNVFRRPIPINYTQIPEYAMQENATVYPNPITHQSKISFTTSEKTNFTFEVYNLSGECIKILAFLEYDQLVVNRNDYPVGVYLYKITGKGNEKFFGKFIIN